MNNFVIDEVKYDKNGIFLKIGDYNIIVNDSAELLFKTKHNVLYFRDDVFEQIIVLEIDNKLVTVDSDGNIQDKYQVLIDELTKNKNNNTILNPTKKQEPIHFTIGNKDYYKSNKNGKYGIVDDLSNIIIPFEYNWIQDYTLDDIDNSMIATKDGKTFGVIDIDNNIKIDFKYKYIFNFYDTNEFYLVQDNFGSDKWAIINSKEVLMDIDLSKIKEIKPKIDKLS